MNPHKRIKIRHLQNFLEVAQQRSVMKAARSLSITQPLLLVFEAYGRVDLLVELHLLEADRGLGPLERVKKVLDRRLGPRVGDGAQLFQERPARNEREPDLESGLEPALGEFGPVDLYTGALFALHRAVE